MPDDPKPSTSSIVMKAIDAKTFTELQDFTKDLESRAIERLLRDVAELVLASESKAQIVGYVIATKFRRASAEERQTILESLRGTIERLPEGEQRERVNGVLERVRAFES